MGTLELQVGDDVVFAHFLPGNAGPNNGGYLGLVFSNGYFKGVSYEELRALGTGYHQVVVDEQAQSKQGQEPDYESEWRRFERFHFTLFMHRIGACVALEVLAAAREVFQEEVLEQGGA